tara:strand:+ start:1004 stop:1858 length:855 start_codon:yes stop_codon:yes gene_type:complete
MATETGRDDFIIAIRSAFLKKGTRQKFSLFTLLIISTLVLSLEYFKSGPVDKFRSFTKDFIYKGSYFISLPFVSINDQYHNFQDHMSMYENYKKIENKILKTESLENEIDYYKSENKRLKKLLEEKEMFSEKYLFSKILLDKQSPYLKSLIVNKGYDHGVRLGLAVREKSYFVGKIIGVNFLTSRILLASDLNSKIPVIIEPGSINAILVGTGINEFAELEYLPKKNNVSDGNIVYTSGIDGIIEPAIPIGKVFVKEDKKFVKFFVDFNQIKFVKIGNYNDSSK